ncbi:hypothetical protein [Paraburkholderia youngii]|uniref:hypothetical protein n=1 Tax=Paraburkholderia youngii TaxID=2782701 RepID=UPI003D22EF5C
MAENTSSANFLPELARESSMAAFGEGAECVLPAMQRRSIRRSKSPQDCAKEPFAKERRF